MWAWWLGLTVSATQQAEAGGLFELSLPNSLAALREFLCSSQSHFILAFWASSDNHHLLLQVRLDLHRQSSLWQTLELRTQFTTSEFENVLVLSFLWYQQRQAFPLAMWSPMVKSLGNKSCHIAEPETVPMAPLWLALSLPLTFLELTWSSQEVQLHTVTLSHPDCGRQGDLFCIFIRWLPHSYQFWW